MIEIGVRMVPERRNERRIITGINWSPAIGNPFRSLGSYGESLDTILTGQRSGHEEPIVFVLHVARPRIEYHRPRQDGGRDPGGSYDDE